MKALLANLRHAARDTANGTEIGVGFFSAQEIGEFLKLFDDMRLTLVSSDYLLRKLQINPSESVQMAGSCIRNSIEVHEILERIKS